MKNLSIFTNKLEIERDIKYFVSFGIIDTDELITALWYPGCGFTAKELKTIIEEHWN